MKFLISFALTTLFIIACGKPPIPPASMPVSEGKEVPAAEPPAAAAVAVADAETELPEGATITEVPTAPEADAAAPMAPVEADAAAPVEAADVQADVAVAAVEAADVQAADVQAADVQAADVQAAALPKNLRALLEEAVTACKKDTDCMASLTKDTQLLTSCPWYEAIGCSVVTAAAVAGCVVTEGEACMECLEAVSAIGCCDCLPSGTIQDMCKAILEKASAKAPEKGEAPPVPQGAPPAPIHP